MEGNDLGLVERLNQHHQLIRGFSNFPSQQRWTLLSTYYFFMDAFR
jgi:hypothetical protein